MLLVSATLPAQQAPAQQPPERVIINFILPVDSNTVNKLLGVVNAQVRGGVKRITIVLSSPGGDIPSAFAAYNIFKNVSTGITTFNAGNIDSAALLVYCAGQHRYSFPDRARFLIHGNDLTLGTGVPLDYNFLETQLQQIKSPHQMLLQVVATTADKDKRADLEKAVLGQTILSPDQAKERGMVQEIRSSSMEPGAVFVSLDTEAPERTV
jgi:ATP-dependent protease ClpP protease subunit